METTRTSIVLAVNALLSVFGFLLSYRLINKLGDMFIRANLFGIDMNKRTYDPAVRAEPNSKLKM